MPIYAYRCEACGYARDVLQKISDAPLTECESCGKPEFKKQLTAAALVASCALQLRSSRHSPMNSFRQLKLPTLLK
jgi:putative FmdB family regulatory protein